MVKYHYEKPPKLLPSLRDILRMESVYGQQQQQQQQDLHCVKSEVLTDDEDEIVKNCDGDGDTDGGEVVFSGCYEMNGNGSCSGESVVNGVLKTEGGDVFNGIDVIKKEVFLPDIVTDVSGEGKMDDGWCMGCKKCVVVLKVFFLFDFCLILVKKLLSES